MVLTPGTRIGVYQVTAKIGEGGMGEVYRARDTKLDRDVALKVLPEAFTADADRLARFEREAKVLASLNHPNIGTIYGFEETEPSTGSGQGGAKALVLELIEGPTLADRIARGPIPLDEALAIAKQIAEALEVAHEQGVIHRDLKPANVKVKGDGTVKVLDFGLAKALDPAPAADPDQSPTLTAAATQMGVIIGTAAYMSPEQAGGETVDQRADVWAFGVVLFEMLTGRQLFTGKNVTHILADVVRSEPDWDTLPANLGPRVRLLLEGCLEKEPRNRLSGISDARVQLQKALADPAGLFTDPVPEAGVARQSRLPWIGAVAGALVVGAAIGIWRMPPAEAPDPVSRFRFAPPVDQSIAAGLVDVVAMAPDGSRFAFAAGGQLYLRDLAELDARPIPGTAGEGAAYPTFSPDGLSVAYLTEQTNEIKRVAIDGGTSVRVADAGQGAGSLSWQPDNSILFVTRRGVMRVSSSGGTPELLVERQEGELLSTPQLLPGGEWVLFSSVPPSMTDRWDDAVVSVQSTVSGDRRQLAGIVGVEPRYVPTGHIVYALRRDLLAVPFDLERLQVTGGAVPVVEGVLASQLSRTRPATANYEVSESGSLVYVARGGPPDRDWGLGIASRNGEMELLDVPPAEYGAPRVAPDGERVAVHSIDGDGSTIWLYDLSGESAMRPLTFEGRNEYPIWSPDGASLTFASDRDGSMSLYRMQVDSAGVVERLTMADADTEHRPEAYASVGRLLFHVARGVNTGIWTLDEGVGSEPEPLVDLPVVNEGAAALSSDGNWMAYISNESGTFRTYVETVAGTGVGRSLITPQGVGVYPAWSPDGTELYYYAASTMMVVGIDTVLPVSWTSPAVVPVSFLSLPRRGRDYDPLPDGRLIGVVPGGDVSRDRQAQSAEIHVVLNWSQELLERVPVP